METPNELRDAQVRSRRFQENIIHSEMDAAALRPEYIAFPKSIFVHISDACNIDCVFCGRQVHDRVTNGLMSYALFESEIGPYLHLADMVQLYGTGEPMLHPHFFNMVELCKLRKAVVMTTTNATLIDDERADRLVRIGLDQMVVSMDGCTPETFRKLRGGSDLNEIKANIQRVNAAKRKYHSVTPYIEIACVVSRGNVHQLCGMVRMARELGAGRIKFYNVVIHKPEHADQDVSSTWRFRWGMKRARRLAERYGIIFEYNYQNPFPETNRVLHPSGQGLRRRCLYATHSPKIDKSGEVYPCCLSHYTFGKLGRDGTLWDILNGERARAFRRGIMEGNFDPICARCGLMDDWTPSIAEAQLARAERMIEESAELTDAERLSLRTRLAAERALLLHPPVSVERTAQAR